LVLGAWYWVLKEEKMESLLIGVAIGFAGGFTAAWLFASSIKKEIASLSGKIDGFIAAVQKL
jgi:hypothetical protein